MLSTITAREMMVSNLITLSPNMDVLDAIDVLLKHRISGAPVVDSDSRFLGIFSERSCMRFILDATYEQLPSNVLLPFIDSDPPTINENTDLLTIAQTFIDASCRRLPVLDEKGHLIGQISRRDVMRAARTEINTTPASHATTGLYLSALFENGERPV